MSKGMGLAPTVKLLLELVIIHVSLIFYQDFLFFIF